MILSCPQRNFLVRSGLAIAFVSQVLKPEQAVAISRHKINVPIPIQVSGFGIQSPANVHSLSNRVPLKDMTVLIIFVGIDNWHVPFTWVTTIVSQVALARDYLRPSVVIDVSEEERMGLRPTGIDRVERPTPCSVLLSLF